MTLTFQYACNIKITVYTVHCIQALEQDRYSLRMQLAQQTKFKENALEEIESVRLHMTAEHQSTIDRLTAANSCRVDQLTKQVSYYLRQGGCVLPGIVLSLCLLAMCELLICKCIVLCSPVWGRGTTLPPSIYFLIFFPFFTFLFLSLASPIFFFCPSLPFLPEWSHSFPGRRS